MTPMEMVKGECAGYRRGECVYGHACYVAEGRRCAYLERAVLPLADHRPTTRAAEREVDAWRAARTAYHQLHEAARE